MLTQQTRAKAIRGICLQPHTTLKVGERGTVVHYEVDELGIYEADVLMDTHHHGLDIWDNVAHITGPELDCIQFSKQWAFTRVNVSKVAILALSILGAFGAAEVMEDLWALRAVTYTHVGKNLLTTHSNEMRGSYGRYDTEAKGVT